MSSLRSRLHLGALVLGARRVTVSSSEPLCSERFTSPLALGSRCVKSLSRYYGLFGALVVRAERLRSLLEALVLRTCHVAVGSWEPWCSELFT
eukprot:9175131-Pyramimonas_sp.AAC.1